ncbi:hypothetical protein PSP6_100117 [Paraburkholderia tropica]|nr:hypothetical protein PSP6_100117 [Paraburkholderia tropica]
MCRPARGTTGEMHGCHRRVTGFCEKGAAFHEKSARGRMAAEGVFFRPPPRPYWLPGSFRDLTMV